MSISSAEGIPAPADLLNKYQKLAAEYAKARSQITVLKQAIRDEQVKSLAQKDQLKTREQELRKDSQELESLVFRNQQLTKRVTFLQEELDKLQSASKKGKIAPENNHVIEETKLFQEELQKAIVQNAALLSKLEEKDLLIDHERFQAEIRIDALQKSLEEVAKRIKVAEEKNDRQIPVQQNSGIREKFIGALPISDVIDQAISVVDSYCESSSSLKILRNAVSSHDLAFDSLLTAFLNFNDARNQSNNPPVRLLQDRLRDLFHLIASFYSNLAEFERLHGIEQAASQVSVAVTEILCAGNYDIEVESPLLNLKASSNELGKAALLTQKKFDVQSPGDSIVPCIRCSPLVNEYTKKIESLELSSMTASLPKTDKRQMELKQPKNAEGSSSDNGIISNGANKSLEDIQNAESKFSKMQCEADAISCRYEQAIEELHLKKQAVSRLQEELSITTRNYEDQLGSMSEHMANMNDKLTAQQAMIEELTYELQNKDTKKSRGK